MARGRQEQGEPYRRISVEEAREMQQEGALVVDVAPARRVDRRGTLPTPSTSP